MLNAQVCLFCSLSRHIAILESRKCKMQNRYLGLLNILILKYSKRLLEAAQVALIANYDYFVAFLMRMEVL